WKAISLQSGDHVAELPRVRNVWSLPSSAFIRNRSETLVCTDFRSLSNTIFVPSGDRSGKPSRAALAVRGRRFVPSGFMREISAAAKAAAGLRLSGNLEKAIVDSRLKFADCPLLHGDEESAGAALARPSLPSSDAKLAAIRISSSATDPPAILLLVAILPNRCIVVPLLSRSDQPGPSARSVRPIAAVGRHEPAVAVAAVEVLPVEDRLRA